MMVNLSHFHTVDGQVSGGHSKLSHRQEDATAGTLSVGGGEAAQPLAIEDQPNSDTLRSQLKSPHFFSMTGIPKFGKNWLDNFIPDEELQNTFLTSEVVRNVIMLQCVYLTSVYGEILKAYKSGTHKTLDSSLYSPPVSLPESHRSNKVTINIED